MDAVIALYIDGLDPAEAREEKEGKSDAGTGRDDDVGAERAQCPPRKHGVPDQVAEIARGRPECPDGVLVLEHRHRVGRVERDPETLVLLPPVAESMELQQMAAGRRYEQDSHRSSSS